MLNKTKKELVFNFIWWFSSPFFIIFFFILLLLYSQGIAFLNIFLPLITFLVFIPLLTEWILGRLFNVQKIEREIVNLILIVSGFIYSYVFYFRNLSESLQFIFIVFAFSIVVSFVVYFLKYNQYSFLLGVFLAISIILSLTQMQDFWIIIIIEFIFSAILFHFFIIYEVDDLKGIFLTYFSGIITTLVIGFIVNFIL